MENSLYNLLVYQVALEISDLSFLIFEKIPHRYHFTGNQFLRAADSVGANIAEGYGRGTYKDRRHFLLISRGSLYETNYWLSLMTKRNLVNREDSEALNVLNARESTLIMGYIKYLQSKIQ